MTPSPYRADKSTIWIPEDPAAVEEVAAKLKAVLLWPERERPQSARAHRHTILASLQAPPVTQELLWVCQKAPRIDIMPGPPTGTDIFRVHTAAGQAQVDLRRVSEVLESELQRVPPKSLQDVWCTSSKRTLKYIGAGTLHEYQIIAALMTSGVSTVHACDSFTMSSRDAR